MLDLKLDLKRKGDRRSHSTLPASDSQLRRLFGGQLYGGRLLVMLPRLVRDGPVQAGDPLTVVVDLRFGERVGKEFFEQDGALGPHSLQLKGTQSFAEPVERGVVDRD